MERALKQFLVVAEEGSITAAANRLAVTQPTITVAIRNLEDAYNVKLFRRSSRGMVLTEFGEILFDYARAMSRMDENARREIEMRRKGKLVSLRIGCGDAWWELFVRDVLANAHQAHPDSPVLVEIGNSFDGINTLLTGDVTLFLGHEIPSLAASSSVSFEPLLQVRDGLFVHSKHPLVGQRVSESDIEPFSIIDSVPIEVRHRPLIAQFDQYRRDTEKKIGKRTVLSSTSLKACIDLMKFSNAVLTYPVVMKSFLAKHSIVLLESVEQHELKNVGIYTARSSRERTEEHTLQDELKRAALSLHSPPDILVADG